MSFSQDLKPIPHVFNGDTLFCFDMAQSKWLAKTIELKVANDSIILHYEQALKTQEEVVQKNRLLVENLYSQMNNLKAVNSNQQVSLSNQVKIIDLKNKVIKRQKWQKWVAIGVSGLLVLTRK